MTATVSPLRIIIADSSDHLGGEADDLGEGALAQLAGDRPEDARAARVLLVVDQHHRVAVEADVAAVGPAGGPAGADDHALDHLARLDLAAGDRLLDRGDDDVAQPGVAAAAAAEHLDAHALFGAGVVRYVEVGVFLNHRLVSLSAGRARSGARGRGGGAAGRLRHHPQQPPVLQLRQGPRLHDLDGVAGVRLVGLVVDVADGPPLDVLAVALVLDQPGDLDPAGLVH